MKYHYVVDFPVNEVSFSTPSSVLALSLSIALPIPSPLTITTIPINAIPQTAVWTASAFESASERFVAKMNWMIAHTKIAAPTYLNIHNIKFINVNIVSLAFGAAANAGMINIVLPSSIAARHINIFL